MDPRDLAPDDLRKRSPLFAIFLTVVVDLVGFGIVLPLLPGYAKDLAATPAELGILMASFSAMQFLFAPLWGRISDRIGRRPVLLIGLSGSVVCYALFGLAPTYATLLATRVAAGVCGATISTASAYIADVTPPRERAKGMALIGLGFGVGFTIGPVLGGLSYHLGMKLHAAGAISLLLARGMPGFLASALSLGSFLFTLRALDEPERHAAIARRVFDLEALRASLSVPGLALLLGITFLSVFSFSNFEGTLALMLEDRLRYDPRERGYVFLFIGVVLSLAQGLIVRRLAPRLGERVLMRAGFVLMTGGLLGVAFADGLGPLLAALAVSVTGFGCVTPSLNSLISRRTDPSRQGAMMGLAQSVSALGRVLGPFVGNIVYGSPLAQATGAGTVLASVFGGLAFHRRPYVEAAAILAMVAVVALAVPSAEDATIATDAPVAAPSEP